jgi:regulator of sigma D
MREDCDIRERWSGVDELIERWLAERQAVIVQFCLVSGVQLLSPRSGSNRSRLQQFCQLLLDYVSAGHFEIYYELLREAEAFKDGSAEVAKTLLPAITTTTESALDFNDRYADTRSRQLPELAQDLSRLGELLATRFDLEDKLIAALHGAHRERVA